MSTIILDNAIITLANIYRFEGVTFEWHYFCGPMLCRKDGEPSKRKPGPAFYALANRWNKLSTEEKEKTRI